MRWLFVIIFASLIAAPIRSGELTIGLDQAMERDAAEITQLCLGGSALSELPFVICEYKGLTYLNMAQNELTELPDCFQNFDKVEELNLSANYLTDIAAMKGMTSLRVLDLSLNDSLPPEQLEILSNLTQLNHLDLSYLNLNAIPESICLLKNLKELILTGNNIAQKDLEKLKQINGNLHIIK